MESGLFKNTFIKISLIIGILIFLFWHGFSSFVEFVSSYGTAISLPENKIRNGWAGANFVSVTYLVFVIIYFIMGYILENLEAEYNLKKSSKKRIKKNKKEDLIIFIRKMLK
jgi:hypothetical protein